MTLRSRFITRWNRHATRKLHSVLPRYTTQLSTVWSLLFFIHKYSRIGSSLTNHPIKSQSQHFLIKSCAKIILLLSFPVTIFTEQVVGFSYSGHTFSYIALHVICIQDTFIFLTHLHNLPYLLKWVYLSNQPSFGPKVPYFFNQMPQLACFCVATVWGRRLFLSEAHRHQQQLDKICMSDIMMTGRCCHWYSSLSVLLSAVETSCKTRTALALPRWPPSEIIHAQCSVQ